LALLDRLQPAIAELTAAIEQEAARRCGTCPFKNQIFCERAKIKKTRLQALELQAGFRAGFMKGYERPARPCQR
jgi:hypothetical protein